MIDAPALRAREFPVLRQSYTEKDAILYALAMGYGSDPLDEAQLRYVYGPGLRVLPTFANIPCHPGFWINDPTTGIDAARAVHGEHHMHFHVPLPAHGTVRGELRVTEIVDKGPGKGALLITERRIFDDSTGTLLASIEQHTLCRGDGGFSAGTVAASATSRPPKATPVAERAPDWVAEVPTLPQAALLYRQSADLNPLHADPRTALAAGFPRPILHGLCTYGIVCRAVLQACAGDQPERMHSLGGRFSAPVFPGETLRVEIWDDDVSAGVRALRLQCVAPQRGVVVFSNGTAVVAEGSTGRGRGSLPDRLIRDPPERP